VQLSVDVNERYVGEIRLALELGYIGEVGIGLQAACLGQIQIRIHGSLCGQIRIRRHVNAPVVTMLSPARQLTGGLLSLPALGTSRRPAATLAYGNLIVGTRAIDTAGTRAT
jgi:hypothetical protein